jgi:hypothetical protein
MQNNAYQVAEFFQANAQSCVMQGCRFWHWDAFEESPCIWRGAGLPGLGFDQEIPQHSTFSKNRHGRFQESNLFEQLFEEIVARCLEAGPVRGDDLSVDGSFVEANASKESRIPREQLAEAAQVNHTVRQYLVELEQQNPTDAPVHEQKLVSTTDSRRDLRDQGWNSDPAGLLRQLSGGQPHFVIPPRVPLPLKMASRLEASTCPPQLSLWIYCEGMSARISFEAVLSLPFALTALIT